MIDIICNYEYLCVNSCDDLLALFRSENVLNKFLVIMSQ